MISEVFWDGPLFSRLDLLRKIHTMHVNPQDGLPSEDDLSLLNAFVQRHLLTHGAQKKDFHLMKFEAKVAHYNNIVDGVAATLVCYAGSRKTEVEAMEKVAWENGLQNDPVRGEQNHLTMSIGTN